MLQSHFQEILFHQRVESSIVDQKVKGQAKAEASQVKIILVQGEQVEMKAVNNKVTNKARSIVHFQIHRRHQHGEVIESVLLPAIVGLTDDHCKHEKDSRGNKQSTDDWTVFEVNRQRHQQKQNHVEHLRNSFVDFESFHIGTYYHVREQKQKERLI